MKPSLNTTISSLLFLVGFLVCYLNPINGQERGLIQSKYYSSTDYGAGTQNWAIVEDKRGVMYFGNVNGVLEFNGESWSLIEITNGSSVRSLSINQKGIIYVGGYNEMGYILPNQNGKMQYHSLNPILEEKYQNYGEVWDINCFSDTVFILTDRYLFRITNGNFDYWEASSNVFYLTHNINNSLYIQELGVGLMKFENDSLKLVEEGEFFKDLKIHSIFSKDNELIVCTRDDGFFLYKPQDKDVTIIPFSTISSKTQELNNYFINHSFYHGVELSENLLALGSITGEILIVDRYWEVVDIINHETLGIKSPTFYLHFSDNRYLWLALDNGISLVEVLSPFRYWPEGSGLSGVITDVARLRDTLYISTGSGVFYSTVGDKENYTHTTFHPIKGNFEQAWEFLYFKPPSGRASKIVGKNKSIEKGLPKKDTILLVATRKGLFEIQDGRSKRLSEYDGILKLYQCKGDSSKLLLGMSKGIAQLSYGKGSWVDEGFRFNIEARINDIKEDSLGNLWLISNYFGIYRVQNPFEGISDSLVVDFYDSSHGLPLVKRIMIIEEYGMFLFYSEGDFYYFDAKENIFKDFGRPQTINDTSKNDYHHSDSLAWSRVWDDIISHFYITHLNDTVIWFGTSQGIFRHTRDTRRNYFDIPSALITKVTLGDSILFYGTNFFTTKSQSTKNGTVNYPKPDRVVDLGTVLKYSKSSVIFFYSFPFFEGEKKNLFSFWLEGYDKNWSEWSIETKKEYTNLPHGKYTFKVKAKNLYDLESEVAEFQFSILPPWHKTYIAFISYFILFILLIYFIVRFYTYRLIVEKDKLEVLVKQRTQEILVQKEEILVQSEHLREANEWISAKNVELEAQKGEIERKNYQLEIGNATKNKFFRIIAHDLRNPISMVVSTTSYILSNIKKFDKDATRHFVEELNKLSLSTYNLLENLLDWSSNQMGEMKFQPHKLDLRSLVIENIELVNNKIDSKGIRLNFSASTEIFVFADENMLNTIVRNLLSNAVKFTNSEGNISINTRTDDSNCYLSISDDGVGISEKNLKNLFKIDKDVRTVGTNNEKGSGLGLILCKEFIEFNGGEIWVESELGKGSTFTISLKLHNLKDPSY